MAKRKKKKDGGWTPMTYLAIGAGSLGVFLIGRRVFGGSGGGGRGGGSGSGYRYPGPPANYPRGMSLVADMANLAIELGAPPYASEICVLQADSESGGDPLVGLGVPFRFPPRTKPNMKASNDLQRAEAVAAEKGFLRNYARYGASPDARQGPSSPALVNVGELSETQRKYYNHVGGIVPDFWCFGSGGLYGQLPSTGLGYTRDRPDLISSGKALPTDVFDPWRATVMHLAFSKAIIVKYLKNVPPEHRNIYALKRAGAALTLVKDYQEAKERSQKIRSRMAARLARNGIDPSFTNVTFNASDWSRWPGAWNVIVEGEKTEMVRQIQAKFAL